MQNQTMVPVPATRGGGTCNFCQSYSDWGVESLSKRMAGHGGGKIYIRNLKPEEKKKCCQNVCVVRTRMGGWWKGQGKARNSFPNGGRFKYNGLIGVNGGALICFQGGASVNGGGKRGFLPGLHTVMGGKRSPGTYYKKGET